MNTPNIRFKRYTDEWVQRKLSDVLEIVTDKNGTKYGKEDVLSVSDEYGCINQIQFQGRSFAGEDVSNYKVVKTGDIVYTRSPLKLKPYGIIKIVGSETGIVSPLYIVNKPKEGYDSQFIYRIFDSPEKTNNYLSPLVRKGAKNTMNISNDEWLSGKITVAPSFEEQYQIGEYFKKLDYLIALHQRKYEDLQGVKKYMLQKMFPQNGSKIPEIRFEGFTGDWEQRRLEDYLDVSNAKNRDNTYSKEDVLSVSGDFGIVNQIEFQGRSFAGASVENYGVVETGDVVYTKSPLKANPYGIIKANLSKAGIVSTLYAVYKPKENVNPHFVQIYFEQDTRMNNYMHPLVNKGAKNDMKVSAENALKGYVTFPSVNEQGLIVEHFKELDNLITLHQRKCNDLKEVKKYMLQNIFPQNN